MRSTRAIEPLELESASNQRKMLNLGILDSMNLTAIFAMFLKETWRETLEKTAHYYLFSFAMLASVINAVLTFRQLSKAKHEGSWVAKAIIEGISAIGIATAVLGGFFANAIFNTVSPIIFTAIMCFKAASHIGLAIYHGSQWGKAVATGDKEAQSKHIQGVVGNVVGLAASVLASVAVGLVMIALKPIYGIVGVIAGALSTGYCLLSRFGSWGSKKSKPAKTNTVVEPLLAPDRHTRGLSDPARLQRRLSKENTTRAETLTEEAKPASPRSSTSSIPPTPRSATSITATGTFRGAKTTTAVNVIPQKGQEKIDETELRI